MTHPTLPPDPFATLLDVEVLLRAVLTDAYDHPPCSAEGPSCDAEGASDLFHTPERPTCPLWPTTGLEPYDLVMLAQAQEACRIMGTDDAELALNLLAIRQAEGQG